MTKIRKLFSAEDGARLIGDEIPPSRFRASWKIAGIVKPLSSFDGRSQVYAVESLLRAYVYVTLQGIFGEQSSAALAIAKGVSEPALLALLEEPVLDVKHGGRKFTIEMDEAPLARIRAAIDA